MTGDPGASALPRRRPWSRWEFALPLMALAWRLSWYPLGTVWRDWVAVLALYWIFTILAGRTKAWPVVTVLVALGLALVYLHRQLPLSLDSVEFGIQS